MPSNLRNKVTLAVCVTTVLAGCATSAPELPRYVSQTYEVGYATATTTANPMQLKGAVSSTKRIAMITRPAWDDLSANEREQIEANHDSRIVEPDQYGLIIDVQGADQSKPGSNVGASVGGAVAGAAYFDNALRGGNYSAVNQVVIGVLGAALGSGLDSKPTSQFQFRYTIKVGDGEIKYFDEVKSTSFRHSVGVCVTLPSLILVSQQVCQQTAETVRKRFLAPSGGTPITVTGPAS